MCCAFCKNKPSRTTHARWYPWQSCQVSYCGLERLLQQAPVGACGQIFSAKSGKICEKEQKRGLVEIKCEVEWQAGVEMQIVVIVRHHFRCRARRLVQVYKTFPYFFHSFYVRLLPLPGFSVFLHLHAHFFSSFALVFLVLGSWWRGILELSSCSKPQKTDRFETQLCFEVGFCSFLLCSIQSLFWSFLVLSSPLVVLW